MPSVIASRELAAAGIADPRLQAGYLRARALNAEHGRTYFLATLLLPTAKRPAVHSLYGFARYADDIVDDLSPALSAADRAEHFGSWSSNFLLDLSARDSLDPIAEAVIHTIDQWHIPVDYFSDFLTSMRMDLTVTEYETYADLESYMWGSAAVIGLQMLPILGGVPGADEAQLRSAAIDLGLAFQLTNFLRDIGEDLDRGRVYLPQESLRRFGLSTADLQQARATATTNNAIRELIAFEIARTRRLYTSAALGIPLVDPTSRACLETALTLYRGIIDGIEKRDHDVFSDRVRVGAWERARVAGPGLVRAWSARRNARNRRFGRS